MDTTIIVMIALLSVVVLFGVAGMAQMIQSQKPRNGAASDEFPQVR